MDRNKLIDNIIAQGNQIKSILQGLDTEHLKRIHDWHDAEQVNLAKYPLQLPGEEHPYNVYIIEWEDGMGYVGMTSQSIIQRMTRHFEKIHIGIASYEFLRRYDAGIGYRFHCLHTNLDKPTAEALEVQEIQDRDNLVNLVHNQNLLQTNPPNNVTARIKYGKGWS